ncbi:MAG: phosphoribosylamine--glycine ligase [Solirubrobacterales bacterium]|nr:phosphoribosylamine--glycine ligase [Solirubrobacterales bacterium]
MNTARPKVLIIGSGAREHALAQALSRSARDPELLAAPGNPGIAALARTYPDVKADDVDAIVQLAATENPELVVIGPEVPLVKGVADRLTEHGISVFGPSRAAARLEGSKAFCKEVMAAAGVPTASHTVVKSVEQGITAVAARYPAVIKADGLAAGKGVVIAADAQAAREALTEFLVKHKFDTTQVVVEEYLQGQECSLFALCDGVNAIPLQSAQDYKRIHDGDRGPNTGGMGSYSPMPNIDSSRAAAITAQIHQPLVDEMRRRGTPFHGLLYAGLMLTPAGPKVIEFNVRFGDPETQALLPRLRSDLLGLLEAATRTGGLKGVQLSWDQRASVTLVLASHGYPESSRSGDLIAGTERLGPELVLTHAGTARDEQGRLRTAGGRVLAVTALGPDLPSARANAYAGAGEINFDGSQMRTDIAAGVRA